MFGSFRNVAKTGLSSVLTRSIHSVPKKRFYKNVSVVQNNSKFEINLDHRKLKTPLGGPFQVKSEPLAHAIANEWLSQKDTIQLSQMHLTGLCNTCIDNPGRTKKEVLVESILGFLGTDTVLFYSDEPPPLLKLQKEQWSPIIVWFNNRYGVEVAPTLDITPPQLSDKDRKILEKHLLSYSWSAIQGISFGVDAIKSLILTLAVLDRRVTVTQAVTLSRLGEIYKNNDYYGIFSCGHLNGLREGLSRRALRSVRA
ncbi:ATP synthase mitochondrial F1 complex assembly factor 2 [Eurytemora carolleeae]|uniref:ATP synthase mitochondrial F1 complex assembly factor 2 n=1 Tax=Eurytemora carolleeae TaxID=1294199 RepID=UPI000C790D50|nr:ATP synthase mitochondrial F1 complex assembly factor 2 [Eurytemora carolleeae]|eukprot:XP_023347358.1 ATP synthase mitochondrial F1 complex assembly factor 2-like [Eurytemora affinis]